MPKNGKKSINICPLTDALLIMKGKSMDRNCKNCEHFTRRSVMSAEHVWGHCMKPGRYGIDAEGRKRRGVFTWDDDSCDDFAPRKIPADRGTLDSP